MAKKNFEEMAKQILPQIGGRDNISYFVHCATRLRFTVRDKSIVRIEDIKQISGVAGAQWSGEQLQVIIGQGVDKLYQIICAEAGLQMNEALDENLDMADGEKRGKISIKAALTAITECFSGVFPAMIAAGFVNVILIILQNIGLVSQESTTYSIMSAAGNAGMYFLPIYVGFYAAKRFGMTPCLGMLLGGIMVHPTITDLISAGGSVSFFGLPVFTNGVSYTSSILPIIMCCWVMSYIEKFFNKRLPDLLRSMFAPLLTVLIMLPLTFCLIGPLGGMLGTLARNVLGFMYEHFGAVSVALLGAFTPLIILTGMHLATIVPYCILCMTTMGFDPMTITAAFVVNICLGVAGIVVGKKSANTTIKSEAYSAGFTSIFAGLSEPVLFGINLKYRKALISAMAGAFVGSLIAGIAQCKCYAFGGTGLFTLAAFIPGGTGNVVWLAVGGVVGAVVTGILTWILIKPEEVNK